MKRPDSWSRAIGVVMAGLIAGAAGAAGQNLPPLRVTLTEAVGLALEQGLEADAARSVRAAAQLRDDAFYARRLPQLSVAGSVPAYNRSIIEVVQPDGSTLFRAQNQTTTFLSARLTQSIPLTGAEVYVSSSLRRLAVSGVQDVLTWNSAPVRIGVRQPVFQANTVRWDGKEQPLLEEAAERQYLETREDIALVTTGLFFDVYAAQVALETARTNAAVNDTLYTLNRGRYEIGSIGEDDLLQSELALLRARTAEDAAELELDRALAALRIGLHLPPSTPLEIEVPHQTPDLEPDTALAARAALRNRSAMVGWELQGVQAERRVAEARWQNRLDATLDASYGFNATGNDFSGAYRDLLDAQQLTVAVQFPLLQWGAGRSEVRAANAELEEVAARQTSATETVAHEARFAALHLAQARRGLLISAQADTVGATRFEIAYNRYVIGRISIDNLFLAQREKDQAEEQYVRALRGYWEAYYQLRRATLYDFEQGGDISADPDDDP